MYLVEVILPLPVYKTFHYFSPNFLLPGIRVLVSFRKSKLIGIVKSCERVERKEKNYKVIEETLDEKPMVNSFLIQFLEKVAEHYIVPIGIVYKIALPSGIFSLPPKRIYLTPEGEIALKKGFLPEEFVFIKKRGITLKSFLKKNPSLNLRKIKEYESRRWITLKVEYPKVKIPTEVFLRFKEKEINNLKLEKFFKVSPQIPEKILLKEISKKELEKWIRDGVLERIEIPKFRKVTVPYVGEINYHLTQRQREVFEGIKNLVEKKNFQPILLFGVTGSGKSLIYLELIKEILSQNKRVMILVPEIALTSYMEMFILRHFKEEVALLHSALSPGERLSEWIRILEGQAKIVLGTRSAVFAPIEKLGLIIVDEEHDSSYKEEYLPCKYHARDLALLRAKIENLPIILGSATPSIKSFYLALQGKYQLFVLKERPWTNLPQTRLIENKEFKIISTELKREIEKTLEEGHSVFLYLNRRGYAPLVLCEECHYIWNCPNCGIPLTYHKDEEALLCHYCSFGLKSLRVCPNCGGIKIKFKRMGTERVEEEIKKIFKKVEIVRLDRDTINSEKRLSEILRKIYEDKPKIIVGTQAGVHGHNFPQVSLVGILRAEEGLFLPHYKASEKTFQLLIQACGRAGRGEKEGKVLFQTLLKDHYVIKYALNQDYESFFKEEIKLRQKFNFPPWVRMALVRLEGLKEDRVIKKITEIKKFLENFENLEILGPSPAPFKRLRGFYRWHLILKAKKYKFIHQALRELVKNFKISGIKMVIDLEPEEIL